MTKNLILLANDSREGFFCLEEQVMGTKVRDSSPKGGNTEGGKFV